MSEQRGHITATQQEVLMRPIKPGRIAKRSQGGKELSYLEAWDVKAHLIRMFGIGNFDIETVDQQLIAVREYQSSNGKDMAEAIWFAKVRLVLRDGKGGEIARYSESAVGGTSGPASMIGEHHDNAVKTAASDALKRCAINLGNQFGLSLYNNGSTKDVIHDTVVVPEGYEKPKPQTTEEQVAVLEKSLGATEVTPTDEATNEGATQEEAPSE